jgi:S1-C subfamily serine protease
MDAQLEHLLKLINGDIDTPDPTDDSDKRPASATDLELLDAYSRAVISVVDSVGPAVVSISSAKNQSDQTPDQVGAGSGVGIAPDGNILTNDHVIQNANTLKVRLTDGTSLSAELISFAAKTAGSWS